MPRLFVFGTLMFPEMMTEVLARPVSPDEFRTAVAVGYHRKMLKDNSFHVVLREQAEDSVDGRLIDLTEAELHRVDHFENALYKRRSIVVVCDGKTLDVFAYLDDGVQETSDQNFDPKLFQIAEMPLLIPRIKDWMSDFKE